MKVGDYGMSRFVGNAVVKSPQGQQCLSRNLTVDVVGTAQVGATSPHMTAGTRALKLPTTCVAHALQTLSLGTPCVYFTLVIGLQEIQSPGCTLSYRTRWRLGNVSLDGPKSQSSNRVSAISDWGSH